MLSKRFIPLAATASLLAGLGIAAPSVRAATFIQFNSQPGDYVGDGLTQTLTPINGYITASGNGNGVSINFNGDTWWNLNFAARKGETLVPGSYEGATRFPFNSPTEPGLDVSGDGRGCNKLTGSFNVLEAAYSPEGEIERFGADFEQHCEGEDPALFGQVRFDRAEFDRANFAKLMELSNKIQQFDTALYFWSQPGDYIGGGRERTLTPADVDFGVSRNFDNSVSFSINNFARSELGNSIRWSLDFAAPESTTLVPGLYDRATRFPFQSPNRPGLNISGNGRGCNQLGGRFKVLEATYGTAGEVEGFDALFEQHCEDELATGPALFGRIRYNASVEQPPVKSVPEPTMMLGLLGISGLMLTQRRRSKPMQQASERLIKSN